MFTREDATTALMEYLGRAENEIGLFYESAMVEPDGIVVYFFTVRTNEGWQCFAVYRDNDGINIVRE